eukprot:9288967-Alexandrium_andersonii.AAC.1
MMHCFRSTSGIVRRLETPLLSPLRTDTSWQTAMSRHAASAVWSSHRSPGVASGSGRTVALGPPLRPMIGGWT